METSHLARMNNTRPPICSYVLGNRPPDASAYSLSTSAGWQEWKRDDLTAIIKSTLPTTPVNCKLLFFRALRAPPKRNTRIHHEPPFPDNHRNHPPTFDTWLSTRRCPWTYRVCTRLSAWRRRGHNTPHVYPPRRFRAYKKSRPLRVRTIGIVSSSSWNYHNLNLKGTMQNVFFLNSIIMKKIILLAFFTYLLRCMPLAYRWCIMRSLRHT